MTSIPDTHERVLLLGCGSVGGVIAGGLLREGIEVSIVTHNQGITERINKNGIRLSTPLGKWNVKAQAFTNLDGVQGPFRTVLLAMKATDVEPAVRELSNRLEAGGYVVTLQNGIVEDRIGEILGRDRVIGALVGWGATMRPSGEYEMTSQGETVIGELDGRESLRVKRLRHLLEYAAPTTVSTNIYGVLWSKLAINCTITTLGAVTGQLLGEMLRQRRIRRLSLNITSEVVDVAEAHGIKLEPVGGTLDVHRLYLPPNQRFGRLRFNVILKHAIMLAVGLKFRRLKSSMLQSLERGRRPEIDFMNGYVVERGRDVDVPTPVNKSLTTLVHEIEAGERPIHPSNLQRGLDFHPID
jgi:2-dehydropantoate 2-reductase